MFKRFLSLIITVLLISFLIGSCNQEKTTTQNKSVGILKFSVEKEGYHLLEIPQQMYRGSKINFEDIRISNGENQIVPWYLDEITRFEKESSSTTFLFQQIDSRKINHNIELKNKMEYDFQLLGKLKLKQSYDSLDVTFVGDNWSFQADVYGRNSGSGWKFIASDSLYNIGKYKKNRFNLKKGCKYQFLRLILKDSSEYPALSMIKGVSTVSNRSITNEVVKQLKFELIEKNKYEISGKPLNLTRIKILNSDNLKIYQLELKTSGNFHRNFVLRNSDSKHLQYGEIYSFKNGGKSYEHTVVTLKSFSIGRKNSELILDIIDGDNQPIQISGVETTCFFDNIILGPIKEGEYSIKWGNADNKELNFDIKEFARKIDNQKLAKIKVGEIILFEDNKDLEKTVSLMVMQFLFLILIILIISAVATVTAIQIKKGREESS